MEKKRSKGVTIVGIIYIALFIVCVLEFIFICSIGPGQIKRGAMTLSFLIGRIIHLGIISILFFIAGTNLIKLRKWALNLSIIISAFCALEWLYVLFKSWSFGNLPIIFISIFFGVICYYLTRPNVKEQFK